MDEDAPLAAREAELRRAIAAAAAAEEYETAADLQVSVGRVQSQRKMRAERRDLVASRDSASARKAAAAASEDYGGAFAAKEEAEAAQLAISALDCDIVPLSEILVQEAVVPGVAAAVALGGSLRAVSPPPLQQQRLQQQQRVIPETTVVIGGSDGAAVVRPPPLQPQQVQQRQLQQQQRVQESALVAVDRVSDGKRLRALEGATHVIAVTDFTAPDSTYLSLRTGDVVEVIRRRDPAMWKGALNDNLGWFPVANIDPYDPTTFRQTASSSRAAPALIVTNTDPPAAGPPAAHRTSVVRGPSFGAAVQPKRATGFGNNAPQSGVPTRAFSAKPTMARAKSPGTVGGEPANPLSGTGAAPVPKRAFAVARRPFGGVSLLGGSDGLQPSSQAPVSSSSGVLVVPAARSSPSAAEGIASAPSPKRGTSKREFVQALKLAKVDLNETQACRVALDEQFSQIQEELALLRAEIESAEGEQQALSGFLMAW